MTPAELVRAGSPSLMLADLWVPIPTSAVRVYNCAYMRVEWDPGKARLNHRKHGVSFADAVIALEDGGALTVRDPFMEEEERWVTMGLDGLGRVLVVVYAWRGENLRLISARKATPRERRRYEDANETGI